MKALKNLTAIALLIFLFTSCGDKQTANLVKELNSSYTYDDQDVELIGYLFPSKMTFVRGESVNVGLYSAAGQSKGELTKVAVNFGQEANSIYMPQKFSGSEVEIYDNNGEKHGYLTKVKVTGTVKYTNKEKDPADYSYKINVQTITIP